MNKVQPKNLRRFPAQNPNPKHPPQRFVTQPQPARGIALEGHAIVTPRHDLARALPALATLAPALE
jgi:hypothetical protein